MNSTIATSSKVKFMAGVTALVATMLSAGATLALADSYARTGTEGQITLAGDSAARNTVMRAVSNEG